MIEAISHVVRFELNRTLTVARLMIWAAFCSFPALLVSLLSWQVGDRFPDSAWMSVCYALVPQISCMLGLLLWATPAIGSEIEAQTWIHLSMRSKGRLVLAIGKYMVAVMWTGSYCIVSSILVGFISGVENMPLSIVALSVSSLCAAVSYAALYLLIGSIFFRRATIVAVLYSLALEGLCAWIPATINQITISYRIRSLMAEWTAMSEFKENARVNVSFGDEGAFLTILIVLGYTAAALGLACYTIVKREYPVQSDM